MSIERQWELLIWAHAVLAYVLPVALFLLAGRWLRRYFLRLVLVVGVAWFAQVAFRSAVELPICMARARLHGDLDYDGVGGNVAVLLAGWLEPLLVCLALMAVIAVVRRLRQTTPQSPHATPGNASSGTGTSDR